MQDPAGLAMVLDSVGAGGQPAERINGGDGERRLGKESLDGRVREGDGWGPLLLLLLLRFREALACPLYLIFGSPGSVVGWWRWGARRRWSSSSSKAREPAWAGLPSDGIETGRPSRSRSHGGPPNHLQAQFRRIGPADPL
uniref:Uncharacterized protein n=1 Tax=Setaria viridis TaxID=4556 RepID=A0A4U6W7P0_SETVI|nr:hypothetical protein SEVIR_1G007766v2 [Setaria viridis]